MTVCGLDWRRRDGCGLIGIGGYGVNRRNGFSIVHGVAEAIATSPFNSDPYPEYFGLSREHFQDATCGAGSLPTTSTRFERMNVFVCTSLYRNRAEEIKTIENILGNINNEPK